MLREDAVDYLRCKHRLLEAMLCPNCGKTIEETRVSLCAECKAQEQTDTSRISANSSNESSYEKKQREKIEPSYQRKREDNEPAGFWLRYWATSVDLLFIIPLYLLTSIIAGIILATTAPHQLKNGPQALPEGGSLSLLIYTCYIAVFIFYYAALESSPWQATFGKKLLGLEVTTSSGDRASFLDCVLRGVGRFLSYIPLSLPFLAVAFRENKLAFHDGATFTRVAKTERTTWFRIFLAVVISFLPIILALIFKPELLTTNQ